MDMEPRRHEKNMARWTLAGSIGIVAGPIGLAAVTAAGFGWRGAFASLAAVTLAILAFVWRMPVSTPARSDIAIRPALRTSVREALRALGRREVLRWLTLLQFSDLMLDVLHGFLALYFVDVVGASGAGAALGIAVWTVIRLLGDVLVIPLLEYIEGPRYLRASACAILVVFPAFLLLDAISLKLGLLGALGLLTSGWYAVLQARLYTALPGRSATVMTLTSAFGVAGAALPLMIGIVAQRSGLEAAMWLLLAGPVALLVGLRERTARSQRTDDREPANVRSVG